MATPSPQYLISKDRRQCVLRGRRVWAEGPREGVALLTEYDGLPVGVGVRVLAARPRIAHEARAVLNCALHDHMVVAAMMLSGFAFLLLTTMFFQDIIFLQKKKLFTLLQKRKEEAEEKLKK